MNVSYQGCEARVWDNGDMTDCGREVMRAKRCAEHIHDETVSLRSVIRECKDKIKECETRIALLNSEQG